MWRKNPIGKQNGYSQAGALLCKVYGTKNPNVGRKRPWSFVSLPINISL